MTEPGVSAETPETRTGLRAELLAVIRGVTDDKSALRILVAAAATMAAVGFNPLILDPGLPTIQAAIRAQPELQSLALVIAVAQAASLLIGGVIGDTLHSRRLVLASLVGLASVSFIGVVLPMGPLLIALRVVASFFTGLALPYAIGSVALAYNGRARATALGLAYAALGGAMAIAPALVKMFGVEGPHWPAFLACGIVSVVALAFARRGIPDLPGALPEHRFYVIATALWAFGVTAIVASVIDLRIDPVGTALVIVGVMAIGLAYFVIRRAAARGSAVHVDLRPVAVVLAVGIIVGFAQAVPMATLPQFFLFVQGIPPLAATLALIPFVLALLAAGPVAGILIGRVGPRTLVAAGMIAIGLADLAIAVALGREASLLLFVVPYALLGAGFVIATTVRTAIIFASVPKRLPASAAALNEASLGLGSRMGIVISTVIITQVALNTYEGTLGDVPPEELARLLEPLRGVLLAFGMPAFPDLVGMIDPATRAAYAEAVIAGMRVSHVIPGIVALLGGGVAFLALGRRDPVREVWEHRDERAEAPG